MAAVESKANWLSDWQQSQLLVLYPQVRTAELLQLHTELRRALFGSAAVLRKSFLPSTIPLDLLKFLKLWDYEGSLTAGVRHASCIWIFSHAMSTFLFVPSQRTATQLAYPLGHYLDFSVPPLFCYLITGPPYHHRCSDT